MNNVGIDVHMKSSQVCFLSPSGRLSHRRVATTRPALSKAFARRKACRILIEAGTESEWVARHLEGMGHEVIIGDPNFKPMYDYRDPHVKTDRRDAEALAKACADDRYRASHRRSDTRRAELQRLIIRSRLVESRTKMISVVRSLLRQDGIKLGKVQPGAFVRRVLEQAPQDLVDRLAPMLRALESLSDEIRGQDAELKKRCESSSELAALQSVPGVGPVTVSTVVAVLSCPGRFAHASGVARFAGLTPRERSSSEKRRLGSITHAGPSELRRVLVQASWCIWRSRHPHAAPLKRWAKQVAARRGNKVAVVALARRLLRILWAMWRDQTEFEPRRLAVIH